MDRLHESRALAIEALNTQPPATLLLSPLDYIFADHFRQRTLCRLLDEIAEEAELDSEKAEAALRYLTSDFGAHVADEEVDLFPMLRHRAKPEDRVDEILGELSQDHEADRLDAKQIISRFSAMLPATGERRMSRRFRDLLRRFSANERHHLVVENAIVMPLARARLTRKDLRELGRRMAARKQVEYPQEGSVD